MRDLLSDSDVLAITCAVLLALSVFLVIFIWSIKRHRDPHLHIDCDAPLEALIPSLAGLTHGKELGGNAIEIFENGTFFDAMIEDLGKARHSVHFETFLWKEGRLGQRLADALCERSRMGISVRVLVDANGCRHMGKACQAELAAAGCKVARYHPWHIRNIGIMNERDHRKIVVLDGKIAYVGGHCIVDEWLGKGQDKDHYRDLSVRVRGPAVHSVQSAFSENWVEVTGELFAGEEVFPKLEEEGDVYIHAAHVKPEGSAPAVKILHHMVICTARNKILIQNPYFLPEPDAVEALGKSVSRGVEVRVMVPSAKVSDMPMVQHAAHRNFARMLELGVRIFEYERTLLHQKVMTVDGVWSAVGTTNFDDRAFEINDEITLGIRGKEFARQLEAIFERDLEDCVELNSRDWAKRGLWHRVKDHALYMLNEHL